MAHHSSSKGVSGPSSTTGDGAVFYDTLSTFEDGVNSYLPELLLPKNQLASALNTTVRGDYVTQRSIFRKITFDSFSQTILNNAISQGIFQGATYFKPDSNAAGPFGLAEGIALTLGGQLFSIFPDPNVNTAQATFIPFTAAAWVTGTRYELGAFASVVINGVTRDFRTITAKYTAGGGGVNSTLTPQNDTGNWQMQNQPGIQNWLWQGEMFVIVNDGASNPIFYNVDTGTATRSQFGAPQYVATTVTGAGYTVAAPGTATAITVTDSTNMTVGNSIYFQDAVTGFGYGSAVVVTVTDMTHITVNNINIRVGTVIPSGANMYWLVANNKDLPPGRMGTNGMGRNWVSSTTGNQFFASDISGGASGTTANQFRDATLHITENAFLVGGGLFSIPGSVGSIQAMKFVTNLDQALGQGPLQVFTKTIGFSCQAPVDRTTWQNLNNPILTESLKGYGATGQNSTINVNSDLLFRSPVGFASQILSRRDFDTWGNVPISIEVSDVTDVDNQTLLNWGSAINFDNRAIFTAKPQTSPQGIIHKALIPLNFDPVSSLRGKQPSIYDALTWTGLNVFQIVVGSFANRERAFAICWDNINQNVDLYEILPTANTAYADNDIIRVTWAFNSASLFREPSHSFKRLVDGEIYVDQLQGQVDFQAWFKPDQWPCFIPWLSWTECQTQPLNGNIPGFRPRMGLGAPTNVACDTTNNRRLDCFYTCDMRFVITGKVRFLGGRFKAIWQPEPEFPKPNCVNTALLAAMNAIGSGITGGGGGVNPPTPPGGNVVVVIDAGGNIITDAGGNVLLG